MSHHIYHTDSFVLSGRPAGEAGKYVYLFTRELGLVGATAQGIRLLQSKLRYNLQDFSRSEVSLVRGKEVWRLTGAKKLTDVANLLKTNHSALIVLGKIFSLLQRLLTGEEKNEKLFDLMVGVYNFIISNETPKTYLSTLETLAVLRILRQLGYFGQNSSLNEFSDGQDWSLDTVNKFEPFRRVAVPLINDALKETQL